MAFSTKRLSSRVSQFVLPSVAVLAINHAVVALPAMSASDHAPRYAAVTVRAPLGLPPIPVPESNPIEVSKRQLGRKLFFDRRLSFNRTLSCALCHIPEEGFTTNTLAVPVGFEGRLGRRNAPTLYNVAYMTELFHDGRENALETQVISPLIDPTEMANPSIGALLERIRGLQDYDGMFERAFSGRPLSVDTLGMALASYTRVLVSGNSPFDRWHYGKQSDAIDQEAKAGFALFMGKAGCSQCHTVGPDHALFTDNQFHNVGLGWSNTFARRSDARRVEVAPGAYLQIEQSRIDAFRQQKRRNDLGRYEVTQDPADRWAYKTPTLRNIALTAPYMHDGSIRTLEEAVEFFDRGGYDHELRSPLLKPLGLTPKEKRALVSFLRTLTGDNVAALTQDARSAGD